MGPNTPARRRTPCTPGTGANCPGPPRRAPCATPPPGQGSARSTVCAAARPSRTNSSTTLDPGLGAQTTSLRGPSEMAWPVRRGVHRANDFRRMAFTRLPIPTSVAARVSSGWAGRTAAAAPAGRSGPPRPACPPHLSADLRQEQPRSRPAARKCSSRRRSPGHNQSLRASASQTSARIAMPHARRVRPADATTHAPTTQLAIAGELARVARSHELA